MTAALERWCAEHAARVDDHIGITLRAMIASPPPAAADAGTVAITHALIEAEMCPWFADERRWASVLRTVPYGARVRAVRAPVDEGTAVVTVIALMLLARIERVAGRDVGEALIRQLAGRTDA